MSQENVEIVRAVYDAWLRGDVPAALARFATEVVTVQPPTQMDARTYHGHAGLLQAMSDWGDQWDDWRVELREIRDADDYVITTLDQHGTGLSSGAAVRTDLVCLFELAGGKITSWRMFFSMPDALAAAGLAE